MIFEKCFKRIALLITLFFVFSCQTPSLKENGMVQLEKSKENTPTTASVITSSNPQSLAPAASKTSEVNDLTKSLTSQEAPLKTSEEKLNLASLLTLQGQFNEAETLCREVLTSDAKNIEALKISAAIFLGRKNYTGAAYILDQIEENTPGTAQKDADIQNLLGLIALYGKDTPDFVTAMNYFEKGLTINPNNVAIRLNIGMLYFKNRYIDEALGQFTQVIKLIPEQKDAKLHLAMIYSAQSKHEIAKDMYKDLMSHYDENPILLYNVASSQRNSKAYEDAVKTIENYLSSESPKEKSTAEKFVKLYEEIEKAQLAQGKKINGDMKDLIATTMKNLSNDQKPAVAKTDQKKDQPKEQALEASLAPQNQPKAKPATNNAATPPVKPQPAPQPVKQKKQSATFDEDDIDSLERALNAH